jgi:Laminin G domain
MKIVILSVLSVLSMYSAMGVEFDSKCFGNTERKRVLPRTMVFCRGQFKYGLGCRGDVGYYGRWTDRPLLLDTSLKHGLKSGTVYFPDFEKMVENAQSYGLDGFGFFPGNGSCFYQDKYHEKIKDKKFTFLPEFGMIERCVKPKYQKIFDKFCKDPRTYKINGKTVWIIYRGDGTANWKSIYAKWAKYLAGFRKRNDNKVLVLSGTNALDGQPFQNWVYRYNRGIALTDKEIKGLKNYLRETLKIFDGINISSATGMKTKDRKLDVKFYNNFLIPLVKSVLAEPAYKDKLFSLSGCIGHENCTRLGYTFDSDGTNTLRQYLDVALRAEPDLLNFKEWDEQNENTSIRPTVYNSFSSKRIFRYYIDKMKNKPLKAIVGDDESIPNLVLSVRKMLTLGEKLKIELLYIPDTEKKQTIEAKIILKSVDGKKIMELPKTIFNTSTIKAKIFYIPTEKLAKYQALTFAIETKYRGKTKTFEQGLPSTKLRATWNWDYKWVKIPLRDMLQPTSVKFAEAGNFDGSKIFTANIKTKEMIGMVEVMDNDAVVYAHSATPPWREDFKNIVLSFDQRALARITKGETSFTVKGAKDAAWNSTSGDTYKYRGRIDWYKRIFYLRIPRDQVKDAVVDYNIKDVVSGSIKVSDILKKWIVAIAGKKDYTLNVSRYQLQPFTPPLIKSKEVSFKILVRPALPTSTIKMRVVTVDGKIYRTKPILLKSAFSKKQTEISVYSSTAKKAVDLKVDSSRVQNIKYDFNPSRGAMLYTDAGRPFWGHFGGYTTAVTQRGGGETDYFIPTRKGYFKNNKSCFPQWVKEDKGYSLKFDGFSNFVLLPQPVISRRSGFTASLDVKPLSNKEQILIDHFSYYPGSIKIFLKNYNLCAEYMPASMRLKKFNSGLKVSAGKWSSIKVIYNQRTLVFEVNGKQSKAFDCPGPGLYDTYTMIGGNNATVPSKVQGNKMWFHGFIKNLQFIHSTK